MFFGNSFNHGIGSVGDLPIPFDTVLNVSALVIVLTFVFLKISWKESILINRETVFEDKHNAFGRILGVLTLLLLVLPGFISDESAKTSVVPLILWVFLWIGVPVLGLIFGDVYAKFNPLAILNIESNKPKNVYVASILFFGLTWFELVWYKPGNPKHIGTVFLILFLVTNIIRKSSKSASIEVDPLLLLHHLYSKLRLINKKPFLKGLLENIANLTNLKGIEYFILLMIGTVTYDGLRGTTFWYNQFGSSTLELGFSTVAFLSINLMVIIFYRFACWFSIKTSGENLNLNDVSLQFGHTMLPIAFAYHVTHYVSLLLYESQSTIYRFNDPLEQD